MPDPVCSQKVTSLRKEEDRPGTLRWGSLHKLSMTSPRFLSMIPRGLSGETAVLRRLKLGACPSQWLHGTAVLTEMEER